MLSKTKTVAILPARCGSEGIPFKNIYKINGQPMISYTINAVKNSKIDEFYVSTDCIEIENVCSAYGAKIIKRPPEISTNKSSTTECIIHSIDSLKLNKEDILITIQPTSPLLLSEDINESLNKLKKYDSVISVTDSHFFLWEIKQNNRIFPKNHDNLNRLRRQDMPNIVYENGAIYGNRVCDILRRNTICGAGKNIGYIKLPKIRSFQVDDYEDIKIIESLLKN